MELGRDFDDDSQTTILVDAQFADAETEVVGGDRTTRLHVGPSDAPERYALRELRFNGGEGELWLGTVQVANHQLPVAVKILRDLPARPFTSAAEKLSQQLELLRSIDHPNVVKVREAFIGPSPHAYGKADPNSRTLYSVMNFVDGEDLVNWVARNPQRSLSESIRIIQCLAAALEYLHRGEGTGGTPVLHRDVKPANVIVSPDGRVRLVDFGMACLASNEAATVVGTPAYMAPEIIAGNPASAASDRYGLGATAYFLITGTAPNAFDPVNTRARLLTVVGVADRITFADQVMTMLAVDPAGRPTEMVNWATSLTPEVAAVERDTAPVTQPRSQRRIAVGSPARARTTGSVATLDKTIVANPVLPNAYLVSAVPPNAYPPLMHSTPMAPPKPRRSAARRRRGFLVGVGAGLVMVATAAFLAPRLTDSVAAPSSPTSAVSQEAPVARRACVWSPEGFSNVRVEPASSSTVIQVLHNADCVLITASQGQWHQLADGGWIHASQLISDNEAVTNTPNLAIRQTPGCHGEIVTRVSDDSVLTVTGSGQDGWYPVSSGDYAGWSSAFHLRGPAVEPLDHELCP